MASDATGPQACEASDDWVAMDLGRLTLREAWRLGATAGERFKLLLIKAQALRVIMPVALPRGFGWRDRADTVPLWAEALFATAQPALEALGMRALATMSLPTLPATEDEVIARALWAEDGRSWTELGAVPQQGGRGPRLVVSCWSLLDDGSALDTSDEPPRLAPPPHVRRLHLARAPAQIYRRHQARLAGVTALAIRPEEVVTRIAQIHDSVTSFHERRGVYVRLSPDEVAARRRAEPGGPPLAATVKAPPLWRSPLALAMIGASVLYTVCTWPSPSEPRPPVLAMWRPTPITVKASEEQLAEALAPLRDRLAASRRPVARVTLEDLAFDLATVSKVGGAPYLAPGASMPETDTGGPMVLLAQINFAELPPMPGYPRAGMLQFFIARDDLLSGMRVDEVTHLPDLRQRGFRIRFVEDVDPEAVTPRVAVRCGGDGCMTPHDPTRPRRMRFAVGEEPISASDVGFPAAIGVEPGPWVLERAAAWGVDENDLAERAFPSAGGHKLGGYPYFTQTDPREPGSPFRLLLQLDTDEELMWDDAGIGAFFITPEDLAARDFSRVLYSWDSH